jgi:hypothetical protein
MTHSPELLVTDPLWVSETSVRVPEAVVKADRTADSQVLVPVTNFGNEPLVLDTNKAIAALDEPRLGPISRTGLLATPTIFPNT